MHRVKTKKSYNSAMLDLVEKYIDDGGTVPYTTHDVAEWAINRGHWNRKSTAVALCARDLARALREDYYTDSKGRTVRARHAVRVHRERGDGQREQLTLWGDHRTMPSEFAERSFKQRRMQIVGDCKQLKVDVDSYNDQHPDDRPIQLVLDFTYDVAEDELGSGFRPKQPR